MASPLTMASCCRLVGRTADRALLVRRPGAAASLRRGYVRPTAGNKLQFKLDERTAHSSLDLFKRDTGVIYRMLGIDPSQVQDNPERFHDWAVVLGDGCVSSGRHYWEVTVRKSQEFRVGVAEAAMSRDECVGTNSASWVYAYVQRKWFAMTAKKMAPVSLVGKPDRVGLLLDYEAGRVHLVDAQKAQVIHSMRAQFHGSVCPAFALWDGELLTHSGLEVPEGLV
ncbi:SPRY domain-containing protein 4 [Denticeps clupeoides]|uniref:B30.2/SPRY domain-containing protein n=1 Tax=Denticeps clupeoides TaxID=299321 RepID=A0AAY4C6W2_9TELE|nr:SPRY domain-containing protein 4 [Denticeps clupeoides]